MLFDLIKVLNVDLLIAFFEGFFCLFVFAFQKILKNAALELLTLKWKYDGVVFQLKTVGRKNLTVPHQQSLTQQAFT